MGQDVKTELERFREQFSFLEWGERGPIVAPCNRTGVLGYKTRDGEVIGFTDPRVREYAKFEQRRIRESFTEDFRVFERLHSAKADVDRENEQFWAMLCRWRPEAVAWAAGENPTYRPTIAELGFLRPAFVDRLRKLRESAVRLNARVSDQADERPGVVDDAAQVEPLPLEPDDWPVLRAAIELGADRNFVISYQVMRKVDPEAAEMPPSQRKRLRDAGLIITARGRGLMLTSKGAEAAKS